MINLLITATVILSAFTVMYLVRISELLTEANGESQKQTIVSAFQNNFQKLLLVVFAIALYGFYYYLVDVYGGSLLPVSASEHGVEIDKLYNFNWVIVNAVFFICVSLLVYFAFKFARKDGNTASFITTNHKLEIGLATLVSIVLAIVVSWGIITWNKITTPPTGEDVITIELYARQFDWTARYAGNDGKHGGFDFHQITSKNALGLIADDSASIDDKLVRNEFHIPIGRRINFTLRSQDVIHSAYMPHFRSQMNCVPGMSTQMSFTPILTTEEMREETGNPEFQYVLLCNKICGKAHSNMRMDIIVESEEDYNAWLAKQKTATDLGAFNN